ncbi:28S ribosomal protein S31, mitochondrial-like [Haliotis rubra]|uniref:28S ribosomal protein S31, mitochondrial-like n=1 Tax=Haliotis rubra TaxID=36100 RepID=UPI001EE53D7D|nr:28S ribosomal protein S31, mitochondrial-like [Haliotis rubra]
MNLQRLRLPHLKLLLECSRQWMTNFPSSVAVGERLGAYRHFSCTHQLSRKKKFPSEVDTDIRETDGVDSSLKEAAKSAASSLPGDAKQTESDLLQQLHNQAKLSQAQREGREATPGGSPQPRQKSHGGQRQESASKTASNTRNTGSKPLDFYFHEDENRGKDSAPKTIPPEVKIPPPKTPLGVKIQLPKVTPTMKKALRDALQPGKTRSRDTRSRDVGSTDPGSRDMRSRQDSLLRSKASHRSPTLRDEARSRGEVRGRGEARGQDLSAWQDSVLPDRRGQRSPSTQSSEAKQRQIRNFKLFSGEGLGLFDHLSRETTRRRSLWDEVQEETLAVLKQNPTNAFEEMIEWTKEGKLWTFPIDNEAGMLEQQNVSFTEHVFLDQHLEGFPTRGPVRHFMDLVTTGLSQNPHLAVQQKKEHIEWFRRYFTEKQAVLEENLGPDGVVKVVADKQLQSQ